MRNQMACRGPNDVIGGPHATRCLLDARAKPRQKQVGCFGRSAGNPFTFNGRVLMLLIASSGGALGARTADPES